MTHAPFPFRTVAALILLAVVATICAALGQWQLGRAAEREAIMAQITAGRQHAPLQVSANTSPTELLNWRSAQVTGRWMNRHTVLLANRNLDGRPGYWVATPLQLAVPQSTDANPPPQSRTDSPASSAHANDIAILVLRGWIPRPLGVNAQLPPLNAPDTVETLQGELRERVPRLFELWSPGAESERGLPVDPSRSNTTLELQNIDLHDFSTVTGIKLLPVVVQQTSAASLIDGTPLVQNWPTPSLDADKNRGYALQWFAFAAIAAGAWLVSAWHALRNRRQRPTGSPNALRKE